MIAESLFIYLLDQLDVNIDLVGHLRPFKGKRRKEEYLPDFAIWDDSLTLHSLISRSNYQLPVYAEVKGSTGGVVKEKLEKSLAQLDKVIIARNICGIIFMAYRNPVNYEGVIFEVWL